MTTPYEPDAGCPDDTKAVEEADDYTGGDEPEYEEIEP